MLSFDGPDLTRLLAGAVVAAAMVAAFAIFYGAPSSLRAGEVVRLIAARSLCAVPLVGVAWITVGAALVFGPSHHGVVGGLTTGWNAPGGPSTGVSFALGGFRMMVAAALPVMISDALLQNKLKSSATMAFVVLWSLLVYAPLAHWVWGGGWLSRLGALDFGGASVIYLSSGASALALAFILQPHSVSSPRRTETLVAAGSLASRDPIDPGPRPGDDPAPTIAGAGILWFCWLISNSADIAHPGSVSFAFVATQLGGAGGALGWLISEWRDRGRTSPRGVAWGLVSGLVAVTAAAGWVSSSAAFAIGFTAGAAAYGSAFGVVGGFLAALLAIAADAGHVAAATAIVIAFAVGAICYGAALLKDLLAAQFERRGSPAVAIHFVGGLLGMLLTGVFAQKGLRDAAAVGALFGNPRQLFVQLLACVASATYAAGTSIVILKLIDAVIGLCRSAPSDRAVERANLSPQP